MIVAEPCKPVIHVGNKPSMAGILVLAVLPFLAGPAAAQCSKASPTPASETWTPKTSKSNKAELTIYTGPTDHGNALQIATGLGKFLWVA